MKIVLLFPGQGSQDEAYFHSEESHPEWRAIHEAYEKLRRTVPSDRLGIQPMIVAQSLAAYSLLQDVLKEHELFFCGHSLGELSCAAILNGWTIERALEIAAQRECLMRSVHEENDSMIALLGHLEWDALEELCDQSTGPWMVNENTRQQVVVAGSEEQLSAFQVGIAGIRKRIPLKVSSLSHCSRLNAVRPLWEETLSHDHFQDRCEFEMLSCSNQSLMREGKQIKQALIEQLTTRVKFFRTIEKVIQDVNPDCFIEIGPGRILTGLVTQITREIPCYTTHDVTARAEILKKGFANECLERA